MILDFQRLDQLAKGLKTAPKPSPRLNLRPSQVGPRIEASAGRERKILLDYLRNNRTNTSICAYSPRARLGAPVSMPVDWNELRTGPERWTLKTVPTQLQRRSDPWADYWKTPQHLKDKSIEALRRL
jgi:DNA primase